MSSVVSASGGPRMKNDVVELEGLQTLRLAVAGVGDRRIDPSAP